MLATVTNNCNVAYNSNRVEFRQLISYRAASSESTFPPALLIFAPVGKTKSFCLQK